MSIGVKQDINHGVEDVRELFFVPIQELLKGNLRATFRFTHSGQYTSVTSLTEEEKEEAAERKR